MNINLVDFGLSKDVIHRSSLSESFYGTKIIYLQKLLNIKGVGKSDLYGIKVVLYEIINGIPPFLSNEISVLFNNIKNCRLISHNYLTEVIYDFNTIIWKESN